MRTIVWGAPCSGKTTYVRDNAKAGDLISDYDSLYSAISGLPNQQRVTGLDALMNDLVDAYHHLIEINPGLNAWIITASREKAKAEELAKRFDAELVVLEISRDEAHKRCDEDGRPEIWHDFIDKWFDAIEPGKSHDSAKQLLIEIQSLKGLKECRTLLDEISLLR